VLQDPITHLDEHGIAGHYRRVIEERHQNIVEPGADAPSPMFAQANLFGGGEPRENSLFRSAA